MGTSLFWAIKPKLGPAGRTSEPAGTVRSSGSLALRKGRPSPRSGTGSHIVPEIRTWMIGFYYCDDGFSYVADRVFMYRYKYGYVRTDRPE